jgi:hypothetical protein
MAYSVRAARQFDGSFSELAERRWRKPEDWREFGGEICASSNQSVGLRSLLQGGTLRRSPIFAHLSDLDIAWLNARCLWRKIRAGELLPDESADGCALSIVTNGRVRAVRMVNGRESSCVTLRKANTSESFRQLTADPGHRRSSPLQMRSWRACPRRYSEKRYTDPHASATKF